MNDDASCPCCTHGMWLHGMRQGLHARIKLGDRMYECLGSRIVSKENLMTSAGVTSYCLCLYTKDEYE